MTDLNIEDNKTDLKEAENRRKRTLSDYGGEDDFYDVMDESTIAENNQILRRVLYGRQKPVTEEAVSKAKRLEQIVHIIARHHILRDGLTPENLRSLLEELGPTFVKIGQIMSKRTDILPEKYCKELEVLCDNSNPLPYETVKSVIEEELGESTGELFSSFEEIPIGSASIGQVHKAVLKDGREVVVKVQRPGVADIIKQDLNLLKTIAKPLTPSEKSGQTAFVDFNEVVDQLWNVTMKELNYLIEARNTVIFRENLSDVSGITCPKVIEELTTSRVFTMEYIDGVRISDTEALQKQGADLKKIGRSMVMNYMKQILEDGFFHADPHQGNLMIRGNELVWIDMGMMGMLASQHRSALKQAIVALSRRDSGQIISALVSISEIKGKLDHGKLYSDIDMLMDRYYTMDFGSMNMGVIMNDIITVMSDNHVELPSAMTMLARGLITIEGVLSKLDPQLNALQVCEEYVTGEMKKNTDIFDTVKKNISGAVASTQRAMEVPGLAADLLRSTLKGQTKINMDVGSAKPMMDKLDSMIANLITGLLVAALLMGSSLICTTDMIPQILGIPVLGFAGYTVALVMAAAMYHSIRKHQKR